ncbi:hypothetical protein [Actinomadura sp. GTD37]|uniref:hypothetical protein n=1 Tax=Actinomadura sp. GTD37 TaxID=1778030 RepID=UPI0035C1E65A
MSSLIFLDTETTGLRPDDDIWEFAAIVRAPDGTERTTHMFIQHDVQRCSALPEPFLTDHRNRFPASDTSRWHPDVRSRKQAAKEIAALMPSAVPMGERPHIVGAVPNFDTERIARLLDQFGLAPGWHYHLIDTEALAAGWVHGVFRQAAEELARRDLPHDAVDRGPTLVTDLPWNSNTLSGAVGVDPDQFDRHTALGDAQWARALWDAVTGGRQAAVVSEAARS